MFRENELFERYVRSQIVHNFLGAAEKKAIRADKYDPIIK